LSIPVILSDKEIIERCQSGELVHDIGRIDHNAARIAIELMRGRMARAQGARWSVRQTEPPKAIMAATGWQAHSVRSFLAGVVRKKLSLTLQSDKTDGVRLYRVIEPQAA
jgi:hypothetical protein